MNNQTSQTPQTTNNGIDEILKESPSKKKLKRATIDQSSHDLEPAYKTEAIAEFNLRVDQAKADGELSIEADEATIKKILPQGLGASTHLMYRGVMVIPEGKTEQVIREMNTPLENRMHGTNARGVSGLDVNNAL